MKKSNRLTREASEARQGRRTRDSPTGIPALDSVQFPQRFREKMPDRYSGRYGGLEFFIRDCQSYFSSLSKPKPTEGQFIRFITSRFCDLARAWAQRIAATRPGILENVQQFMDLFFEEFGERGIQYDLDEVLGDVIWPTDAGPLFHEHYAHVRQQRDVNANTTAQLAESQFQVTSPFPITSPVPAISPVHVKSRVTATLQSPVTAMPAKKGGCAGCVIVISQMKAVLL
ncbi:hypothetical protein AMELA_G00245330 [Ameiurus melas]|uniref:DUF4939 domain-containing protein n=1 Tax=Ameiurus melas TaxID=219545 RepID=A0A7J5ZV38_AMEME|nr:hypothetical protein AMELA_G00245330 [Ameiurus melas]